MSIGIRKRLAIYIVIVSLIPLLIIGSFGYLSNRATLESYEQDKIHNLFKETREQLIKFFIRARKDTQLLADITEYQVAFNAKQDDIVLDHLKRIYYSFSKQHIDYDKIKFIDTEGKEIINIYKDTTISYISDKQYTFSNMNMQDLLKLKDKEVYITNNYVENEKDFLGFFKPVVDIISPVYIDEEINGYVVITVNLKSVLKELENTMFRSGKGELILVDHNGNYLLHPIKEKEIFFSNNKGLNTNIYSDIPKIASKVMSDDSKGTMYIGNKMFLWQSETLHILGNRRVGMLYTIDIDIYRKPLDRFKNIFIIVLLIAIVALIIIGHFFSKMFTNPIYKIMNAVNDIGNGNFNVNIDIDRNNELCSLSIEITEMACQLQKMYLNMESIVDERTKELNDAKTELEKMVIKDPLTNLYNRHYFNKFVKKIYKEVSNCANKFVFIMLDVNSFKYINDVYGHNVGDIVLVELANILKNSARKDDIVIRYGGDEFLIVLNSGKKEAAFKFIERVNNKIDDWSKISNVLDYRMSISTGYDIYDGSIDILDSIDKADKMMYKNKMINRKK
ncbi:sensor domain-containing diguanylate cyclase [Abyssisolibacter fermentans]|uniref:sensor domain-containing diguanylate cyclase n=1 Tax=Abyssisolibacter fermentans TaxID=1766203 RepID=UPI000835F241|nr:sensor domain-containing diguanylate cyclase [Abyssisolibacter fermentans]